MFNCSEVHLQRSNFLQDPTQILIPSMLYVHYRKLLILWICLILPKGYTTMIFSLRPKSESIESVNFLRRIGPQTNVMPKSFTLGGFSHSAVQFRAKIKVLLIKQNLWLFSITNKMYVCHLAAIRRTRLSCYWVIKSLHTQTKHAGTLGLKISHFYMKTDGPRAVMGVKR